MDASDQYNVPQAPYYIRGSENQLATMIREKYTFEKAATVVALKSVIPILLYPLSEKLS